MRFHKITYPDVENGLGCRVTLWISGCSHRCEHCHNKETWDFESGNGFNNNIKEKLFSVLSLPYIKGLTLSGGDPLDSYADVLELCKEVKNKFPNKDIWLYSGYELKNFEELGFGEIVGYVDYIVDGEFKYELADRSLAFRGSSNQIIWEKKNGNFIKSDLND